MQPRTFRNFQPNDHIRSKKGEIFQLTERLTRFCKGCDCRTPCATFQQNTMLTIKSQRGIWEMSLKEMNDKYQANEIDEVTYIRGQWK